MKHLILTRFNVRMPGWNSQVNLDPNWLSERFDIFEKICLPSVAQQTNQNFNWVVFFDQNTPKNFKQKIDELTKRYRFYPVYVEIFQIEAISEKLLNDFGGEAMLLTSRLDSDDILAIDYVEKIQAVAKDLNGKHVINFDNGAILFSKNNKKSLYKYQDVSNPFTSLLEGFTTDLSTILAVNHTALHQFAEVLHIQGKPMWLQLVHGGNVSNRVRGVRVEIDQYNEDFPYMKTITQKVKESHLEIIFDNYFYGSIRKVRDLLRLILKRIYFFVKNIIK